MNSATYNRDSWTGYQTSGFQPQAYPSQAQPAQSPPERKLKTDSSRSSTVDMKSQSEEPEAKSSSNYEDVNGGYELSATELMERAYELAKDQSGCRQLQKLISKGEEEVISNIYTNILPKFVELMNNSFGNYL